MQAQEGGDDEGEEDQGPNGCDVDLPSGVCDTVFGEGAETDGSGHRLVLGEGHACVR